MTLTDGTELAFEYNSDGLRTSKTAGNSTVQYVWNDGNLVAEIRDGYTLKFLYNNGECILLYRSSKIELLLLLY